MAWIELGLEGKICIACGWSVKKGSIYGVCRMKSVTRDKLKLVFPTSTWTMTTNRLYNWILDPLLQYLRT